jgi:uncharacterized protein GlcG (DUF336 family)
MIQKTSLSLSDAKLAADAAEQAAAAAGLAVVIAVVDDGGNLLYLARMEGAPIGSVEVAQAKARTAARFKCETKDLEAGVKSGVLSLLSLDLLPFEGGIPFIANSRIAGAIGVSGSSAVEDGQVARAGIAALESSPKQSAGAA